MGRKLLQQADVWTITCNLKEAGARLLPLHVDWLELAASGGADTRDPTCTQYRLGAQATGEKRHQPASAVGHRAWNEPPRRKKKKEEQQSGKAT